MLHYEYCLGAANSNPSTWRVVLRFAKRGRGRATYEFVDVVSREESATALTLLKRRFWRTDVQARYSVLPDGGLVIDLDGMMERFLESYANWYGEWHFRRGRRLDPDTW